MIINWKNYQIRCSASPQNSWDLHMSSTISKDDYEKAVKMNEKCKRKTNVSIGDKTWRDCGFFTNLDTLFNRIIREETVSGNETMSLDEYLSRWEEIIDSFVKQVKDK